MAYDEVLRVRDSLRDNPYQKTTSIFHELFHSSLPPQELNMYRMAKEGFVIVAAGGDTTGGTLSGLIYHLSANPQKRNRLRRELRPLFEDVNKKVTWTELEQLPYMASVIKEGLRLNHGVASRLPRCAPDRETRYGEFVIPRGTPVSMSIPDVHLDESIFPQPLTWAPERWLDDVDESLKGMVEPRQLESCMCSFGKGTRQCLGMK
jgi:cytochrome P450